MDFALKPEERDVVEEVRELIAREVTPELINESLEVGMIFGAPKGREFAAKVGAAGLLTPDWPEEYGGRGASGMVTYLVRDELAYALTPYIYVGAHMAGPSILRHANDDTKAAYLPRIAKGEIEFALGYTEPGAGSDLASLIIKAEDKGDHYLINGQKTFNTHTHLADYHWLLARTDPESERHKGVSLFVVDLKSPGIEIRPMVTMAGWQTNEVYYDDVVVPKECLVGEQDWGFYYVMTALEFERMVPPGGYRRLLDDLVAYVRQNPGGHALSGSRSMVQQKLAQLTIEMEVCRLLYYQLASMLDQGKPTNYRASMEKMFATEVAQRITRAGMEVLGLYGQLRTGSPGAPLDGIMEHFHRWSVVETIYGGTSEIQRNIIAQMGFGITR